MSTGSTTKEVVVVPFTIEADHPRNCDLALQCIPGSRLRSAIDGTKGVHNENTGEYSVPIDQSRQLASFPRTPGMRLSVNPAELTYEIFDPLTEDERLTERISKWMRDAHVGVGSAGIKGVKTLTGKLDPHQMKSLCREVWHLLESKEAKVVKGPVPDMDDIEQLPGHFLLNPGMRTGTTQPRYEKDFADWVDRLSHNGG